ncbi:ribonuclease I [Yokenella regensburgei]|uniref:ribonuclease I n=1 Tax=Yokenella regensburgei TaxID=158877 RepID=UPI003F150B04
MLRKGLVASLSVAVAILSLTPVRAEPLVAKKYGDFDSYVLALSWQTGFCQSQHDRGSREPDECRLQKEPAQKRDYLTVHGLWPGLPKSIAARGVDNNRWMRYGCASRPIPDMPEAKASRKCAAAETGLSLEMADKLNAVMPGAGGNSCLERYEYAKHGVCFGFDPDAWSGVMVRLNQEVRQSPLGTFLATHYGKRVTRRDLDLAMAQSWGDGSIKSVKLSCSGKPAYLTELQFTLDAESINEPLTAQSFRQQPHPGNCGESFIIDPQGY